MFHPPSGEEGIWFSNPATAYKVTSIGVSGTRLWNRIIVDRQKKLETYGVEKLLKLCAKSHKVNVYKHMCNIELQEFFTKKEKITSKKDTKLLRFF
jgi:hypothetical protein